MLSFMQAAHVIDNEIGSWVLQGLYLKNDLFSIIFGEPMFNAVTFFRGFKDSIARLKNRNPWIADASRIYDMPLARFSIDGLMIMADADKVVITIAQYLKDLRI